MKFTLNWLKDHLDTEATLEEIVEAMVRVGLEVEEVINPAQTLSAYSIGEVLSAEKHPDADKLRVCKVATKDGEKQIVCGAPNARAGIKVVYAPVGTYVSGIDVTLSKAKIRGVESFGMMCSARELEIGDDHDGIIEAPADATVGDPVHDILGVGDPVIDFEVTPNRPDTNGVIGVARDLAAAGLGQLTTKAVGDHAGSFASPQKIELVFDDATLSACPIFAGIYVRGVKNGPSPQWLQDRLRAIGLRPINALVDITNYVSYDRARPLHVYDADKLTGTIRARLGVKGEKLLALDGKEYEVDDTICVIADDRAVLGLGGVMGGEETGCTEETQNVFIECAYFDPLRTAKTGRKTGIVSDARYRFERGVDPAFVIPGAALAAQLVHEFCGGEASEIEIAGEAPIPENTILFPPSEVKRLTGIDVDPAKAEEILEALGFGVSKSDPWQVDAPSWRPDIGGKADIVEEITRIVGLENLPTENLPVLNAAEGPKLSPIQIRRFACRRALAARGLLEAVTWSFLDEKSAKLFARDDAMVLSLANPIASDLGVMRPSLLPNLINALQRNADRSITDLALFEVAGVYHSDQPDGQANMAAGARRIAPKRHWQAGSEEDGVFTVKADALAALSSIGAPVDSLQAAPNAPGYFHPGRSGALQLGPAKVMAYFGEVHPGILEKMDVDGPVFGFEIMIDAVPAPRKKGTKTKPALPTQDLLPLSRDFAFLVDDETPAAALIKAIKGADKAFITAVSVFDVYRGKGVAPGKKSVAIEVVLQPKDKTLTDEEIDAISSKIVAQATKATGAELRA